MVNQPTLAIASTDSGERQPSIVPAQDPKDTTGHKNGPVDSESKDQASSADLKMRVDGMATWATQVNSDLRGLIGGSQVLSNAIQGLEGRLDVLADHVAAIGQSSDRAVDAVVGYCPTPEQQGQLFAALAEWQLQAKPLEKGSVANIQTRGGSLVSYRYADIAAVSEIARSAGQHGLSHFHCEVSKGSQTYIRTYLTHKSGGWISCDVPLLMRENSMTSNLQQWASTCTMARRYGLFMVLGIAAGDEDDDGAQGTPSRSADASPARTRNGYNKSTSLTPQ